MLAEVGLTDLMDEALLLTTELATNGVIHAGTDIDVDVAADDSGVTVTVTDYASGPIEPTTLTPPDEMAEHGRGLLLVDQFASSWGTSHDSTGKGVWFRLDNRESSTVATKASLRDESIPVNGSVADDDVEATARAAERVSWLIHIGDELRQRLTMSQLVSEMLLRLCEVVGASGGTVWLDTGDGQGEMRLARYGTDSPHAPVIVPLPVNRPHSGRIELHPDAPAPRHWNSLAALSADRIALVIETDRVTSTDRRRRGWLHFLAEAGELLAQSLDVDLTMALIPQIMVPRLGQWCAIHVVNEWDELELSALSHADEGTLPRLKQRIGDYPVSERLEEARAVGGPVPLPKPVEGVLLPLIARGGVLGALSIGRPGDRPHSPDDLTVLQDAARRAALAIDNARIHSDRQQIAQAFQNALLPSALPKAHGLGFAAEYVPASTGTDVGGDFYDVVELSKGRYSASIGDVCGKGAQAAALTGLVRDILRVMARDERPVGRTLELLNHTLLEQPDEGRYATVATARVDQRDDGRVDVELFLSGHEKPLLLRADGRCEYVGREGTAVGLLPSLAINPATVTLDPGDALVFYTDGVTERRNGSQLFGHSNICRSLRPMAGFPAGAIAARLRSAVAQYSSEDPRDDMAVLVIANENAVDGPVAAN
ncbi:PPM-type phosphatase domain-containing protein [Stackebrandtia soli]